MQLQNFGRLLKKKKKKDILQTHLWELPTAHFRDDIMPYEPTFKRKTKKK